MKKNQHKWRESQIKLLTFTLTLLFVSACAANRSREISDVEGAGRNKSIGSIEKSETRTVSQEAAGADLKKSACQKYESCNCQEYGKCLAEAEKLNYPDEVWECMLKSSCESLCAGKPDACRSAESSPKADGPETPSCPQIRCSKNSDCPGGCYGGCSDGHCLLF
jgi:hypothetical protein